MIGRVTETLSKVKGSLGSNERHALPGVIGDDLLRFGKLPLCLFICIIITALRWSQRPTIPFIDGATRTDGTGTRCAGY
jgi:hypothetical protein